MSKFCTKYIAVAKIGWDNSKTESRQLVSAYLKYAIPTVNFTKDLENILLTGVQTIVGADVNGHSKKWHCSKANQ